jgi:hypothetical protein
MTRHPNDLPAPQATPSGAPLTLHLGGDALRPLVQQVVTEALAQLEQARAALPDKLAYSEAEAAALLSLEQHQLRDERRRGRIEASVGPGRKILYSRQQLVDYLARRPWQADGDNGQGRRSRRGWPAAEAAAKQDGQGV